MKSKWSGGKIAAVICGSIAGGGILLMLLFFSVFFTVRGLLHSAIKAEPQEQIRQEARGDEESAPWEDGHEAEPGEEEPDQRKDWSDRKERQEREEPEYYEFHNEIREDLSYQVHMKEQNGWRGSASNISSTMVYPEVQGRDTTRIAAVNQALLAELQVVDEYLQRVAESLEQDMTFAFDVDCYVTYMDEQMLSVVYREEGWLDNRMQEAYLISVNLDMESGIPLTNSQILEIDEEFAIDFRERNEEQNGSNDYLDMYSDQDIMELLNSEENLIIFYTPLGMEVGMNYYDGWATVTYKDYEKYLRKF